MLSRKLRRWSPIISLNNQIQVTGDLSLIPLSRSLDEANLNKEVLRAVLEKAQDQLIDELCGRKYARNQEDKKFQRAGTAERTLVTRHGIIRFKLVKVKSLENGTILRPFLLYLGLEPRKRIVDDLDFECAETAILLTYRDSQTVIRNLTKATVPKSRIHSYVQEVGAFVDQERRKTEKPKTDLLYADGTKAHGLNQKKNEINVIIGKDAKTGEKSLLGLTVNREWRETAKQVKTQAEILVADADKPLRIALLGKALNYQLCVNHSVKEVSMHLWKAGLPKNERREILGRLRAILHTCRNSALKHLEDGDTERLQWRINKTLADLKELAKELVEDGLMGTAKFLRNSANYLVTFARLAAAGIKAPYTNNLIERLMGEIAKRVKNKWMHWSTQGLENLLNILLVRYCNEQLFSEIKEKYLNQGNKPLIQITIT
nr:transposase [Candidatus Freyarchaeota archaeon]